MSEWVKVPDYQDMIGTECIVCGKIINLGYAQSVLVPRMCEECKDAIKFAKALKNGNKIEVKSMADIEKVVEWLNEIVNTLGSFTDESEQEVCQLANDALELLKEQRKTGAWKRRFSSCPSAELTGGSRTFECSLCNGWGRKTFMFCPHCGAKMERS